MMAGKRVTIEEKIERQKEVVSRIKDKYDAALDELEKLMQKREELRKKELLDAFVKSDRTCYRASFAGIPNKYQMDGESPEAVVEGLIGQFGLGKGW